ncbi:MAG: Ig-like domain-containing protein, partial [Eggerthellaceae bacterium]|nr:Ig-like domain-containing protein [Eggerthellaceae bacterium]
MAIALVSAAIAPEAAFAAGVSSTYTQDGLTATLTADKASYAAGETAAITVAVTNNNSFDVSNVRLSLKLPAGMALASGQASYVLVTLKAGETQGFSLTALVTEAIPLAGDGAPLWPPIAMIGSAAAIAAALALGRKGKARHAAGVLPLVLGAALVLAVSAPSLHAFAATESRSFDVSQPVTVAGVGGSITLTTSYDYESAPISQAPLTITGGNIAKTYGDAGFALTATGGSTGNPVTWTSNDTSVAAVDNSGNVTIVGAGTATITATMQGSIGNPGNTPDYLDATAQITLTVNPATLTVTADDKSRDYGEANPTLTFTYSGWVLGEGVSALTTVPTASCAATTTSNTGTYAITVSGGAAANYTFSYQPGTLTVNPAPLSVTADDKSMLAGENPPALTISYSGFKGSDTAASITPPTISTTATSASTVGTYPITLSGGSAANYTLTLHDGTMTVSASYKLTYDANGGSNPPAASIFAIPAGGGSVTDTVAGGTAITAMTPPTNKAFV